MKEMPASEFKAKCLAVLDAVAATGESVTILKRGKPVARLVPTVPSSTRFPQEALKGTVDIRGDLLSPILPADAWEAEGSKSV